MSIFTYFGTHRYKDFLAFKCDHIDPDDEEGLDALKEMNCLTLIKYQTQLIGCEKCLGTKELSNPLLAQEIRRNDNNQIELRMISLSEVPLESQLVVIKDLDNKTVFIESKEISRSN